jgi:FkbM family methyltransferase
MGSDFLPRRLWREARYRRVVRNLEAPKLIRAFADAYPEAFFIEIGSNDGEQHDHLRPFILSRSWRGIMVEPVPYVFQRLRRHYGGLDRVVLENVAIADRDGRRPFYHLAEAGGRDRERLPSWYDGIGSFSREGVLAHADQIPDIRKRLVRTEVPCLTFESLCRRHRAGRVDLLLVDAEGYDWEILRQIDFHARRPRLLIYEHYHLHASDQAQCREHLERLGYETEEEGFDTLCLDTRADDPLTRTWRRLRPGVPGVSAHE